MTLFEDNPSPYLTVVEQGSKPSAPAAGKQLLYMKTDHKLYHEDSGGTETEVAGGVGGGDFSGPGSSVDGHPVVFDGAGGKTGKDGGAPIQFTAWPPRSLWGLELANNGSDANNDIDLAVGGCRDDANAYNMALNASITKQLDAAWSSGTNVGGLDTGSKANSTWYHLYLIRKDADGTIDALFTATYGSPTMPAGYSNKKYLGSILTNSSGNIRAFKQYGNYVIWGDSTLTMDVSVANLGNSRTLYTLASVPPGPVVKVKGHVLWTDATTNIAGVICSPDLPDVAVSVNTWPHANVRNNGANASMLSEVEVVTNASAQIAARSADTSTTFQWATVGWEYIR